MAIGWCRKSIIGAKSTQRCARTSSAYWKHSSPPVEGQRRFTASYHAPCLRLAAAESDANAKRGQSSHRVGRIDELIARDAQKRVFHRRCQDDGRFDEIRDELAT